jgi:hypothetical protein
LLADEGETAVQVPDQAMIEQDGAPDGNNTLVSLFQADSLGLKIVRTLNWQLRRKFVTYASGFSLSPATATTA